MVEILANLAEFIVNSRFLSRIDGIYREFAEFNYLRVLEFVITCLEMAIQQDSRNLDQMLGIRAHAFWKSRFNVTKSQFFAI